MDAATVGKEIHRASQGLWFSVKFGHTTRSSRSHVNQCLPTFAGLCFRTRLRSDWLVVTFGLLWAVFFGARLQETNPADR